MAVGDSVKPSMISLTAKKSESRGFLMKIKIKFLKRSIEMTLSYFAGN